MGVCSECGGSGQVSTVTPDGVGLGPCPSCRTPESRAGFRVEIGEISDAQGRVVVPARPALMVASDGSSTAMAALDPRQLSAVTGRQFCEREEQVRGWAPGTGFLLSCILVLVDQLARARGAIDELAGAEARALEALVARADQQAARIEALEKALAAAQKKAPRPKKKPTKPAKPRPKRR